MGVTWKTLKSAFQTMITDGKQTYQTNMRHLFGLDNADFNPIRKSELKYSHQNEVDAVLPGITEFRNSMLRISLPDDVAPLQQTDLFDGKHPVVRSNNFSASERAILERDRLINNPGRLVTALLKATKKMTIEQGVKHISRLLNQTISNLKINFRNVDGQNFDASTYSNSVDLARLANMMAHRMAIRLCRAALHDLSVKANAKLTGEGGKVVDNPILVSMPPFGNSQTKAEKEAIEAYAQYFDFRQILFRPLKLEETRRDQFERTFDAKRDLGYWGLELSSSQNERIKVEDYHAFWKYWKENKQWIPLSKWSTADLEILRGDVSYRDIAKHLSDVLAELGTIFDLPRPEKFGGDRAESRLLQLTSSKA